MDFDDSGIESDPRNSSEKDTLKQHNEPIISFSPERCRFDSIQSSSRKSSTSYPISVADLQLDAPSPPSSSLLANNNCNSIANLQNSTKNGVASQIILPKESSVTGSHPQTLLTNAHNKQQQQQHPPAIPQPINPAYPFLLNKQQAQQQTSSHSSLSSTFPFSTVASDSASLVISTNALSSTTSSATYSASSASANCLPRAPGLVPTRTTASVDSSSISLMVNGTGLNANNSINHSTTTSTGTTTTTTTTTLDLQKRLEKRIAQASAITAAAASSSSLNATSSSLLPSSTTASGETKGNDSFLSDIISNGITNKAIAIPSSAAASTHAYPNDNSEKSNGNQISFSPPKTSLFTAATQQIDFPETGMSTAGPASLWESDPTSSSAIDLWENKEDEFRKRESLTENFMDTNQRAASHFPESSQPLSTSIDVIIGSESSTNETDGVAGDGMPQLDLTGDSGTTTSCKSGSTSGGAATSTCSGSGGGGTTSNNNNTGSVNRSSGSKNSSGGSHKTKGNQSLKNNNNSTASTNVPSEGASAATSLSSSSASSSNACSGGGGSTPATSVITVVNASFDIRKVSALLPPQRMAIPSKSTSQFQSSHSTGTSTAKTKRAASCSGGTLSGAGQGATDFSTYGGSSNGGAHNNNNNPGTGSNPSSLSSSGAYGSSTGTVQKTSSNRQITETSISGSTAITQPPSGNGNIKMGLHNSSAKLSTDSEKKPLVQWDSDESEEELSFFPPAKRGVITDNLSIDNMSLSGEEEDLHLTPPRPLAKKCPCDPRSWVERTDISSSHHHHGDATHSISSKFSCTIF